MAQFTGMAAAMEEQEAEEENEILYLCTFEGCGKGFADPGSLRKHAHTHGEKQFICHYDGCGKVRNFFFFFTTFIYSRVSCFPTFLYFLLIKSCASLVLKQII